jgi:hypothetical protein
VIGDLRRVEAAGVGDVEVRRQPVREGALEGVRVLGEEMPDLREATDRAGLDRPDAGIRRRRPGGALTERR